MTGSATNGRRDLTRCEMLTLCLSVELCPLVLDSSEAVNLVVDRAEGSSSRVVGRRRERAVLAEAGRVAEPDRLVHVRVNHTKLRCQKKRSRQR